jgi:hypothetical protein
MIFELTDVRDNDDTGHVVWEKTDIVIGYVMSCQPFKLFFPGEVAPFSIHNIFMNTHFTA